MKTKWLLLITMLAFSPLAAAQPWRYQLLEGSFLMDECLICDRLTLQIPMRGSFTLRPVESTPMATRYAIENAAFQAGADYHFAGAGTYELSGQLAVRQTITLTGELRTAGGTQKVAFTNEPSAPTRRWPMIAGRLIQTNGTLLSTITLDIAAAPLQEIWFSVSTNFLRAIRMDNTVSSGDLLSTEGRVVMHNSEFQEHFPGPTFENMGLDAIDILPGSEIVFSTETKGVLGDGDFAFKSDGSIVRWTFMQFLGSSLTSDPGLDTLLRHPVGGYYFSIKTNAAGLEHGSLYRSAGSGQDGGLVRSHADFLAQFHPSEAKDYGLDAFYIWPSGEMWFSTSLDFSDSELGAVSQGDLLSDAGYIVYRNRDLVESLRPVDDTNDFGLDAVLVISDAATADGATQLSASLDATNGSILFTWAGGGRVFQLERALEAAGPWQAVTPIIASTRWDDLGAVKAYERAFYRLRQW